MADALVISHRTNMGGSPENSLEGIAAALAEGVDGIELDVRASRDGVACLLHDASLERTFGDRRLLADIDSTQAEALGVPTLEAALAAIGGRATAYIELKERGLGVALARTVLEAGAAAWCSVWAFDPQAARECRAVSPAAPVALNVDAASPKRFGYGRGAADAIEECARSGFAAISVEHRLINAALVRRAHARGLEVFTWTVDEPREIQRVLDAGVDGVCGNFPPRIRAVLEARARAPSG